MIKVFSMNDCDWVAAETLEEARDFYKKNIDPSYGDDDPEEIDEKTPEQMNRLKFCDEDAPEKRTFQEELDRRIAAGVTFPEFFASTEF